MELTAIELKARREEIVLLISDARKQIELTDIELSKYQHTKYNGGIYNKLLDENKQWHDELKLYFLFLQANRKNLIQLLNPTLATNYAGN